MSQTNSTKKPIGDPPAPKQPVRADELPIRRRSNPPMIDPFTEQSTHPAGVGQGENSPDSEPKDRKQTADSEEDDDEGTMPIEKGFSPIP
jgi:hypothetical protein